jgi:hypothetical protein
MEEIIEKLDELVEEARRDGNKEAVPYLERVRLVAMHQGARLVPNPEQLETIKLFQSVFRNGLVQIDKEYLIRGRTSVKYGYSYGPTYSVYLVNDLSIYDIDLEIIRKRIKELDLMWINVFIDTEIDDMNERLSNYIYFSNVVLYCLEAFKQYGWKRLQSLLIQLTYGNFVQMLEEIKSVLSDVHGYQTFDYKMPFFNRTNLSRDDMQEHMKKLHKHVKYINS